MKNVFLLLAIVGLFVTPLSAPEPNAGEAYTPRNLPEWMAVCNTERLAVLGAPFAEAVPVGSLARDERILAAEMWQGWIYVYQAGWVDSDYLCQTWQPEGWDYVSE